MENINVIILKALQLAKENKWAEAHNIAQSNEGQQDFDRLHAFLHRQEGDEYNARYWYKRCKTEFPDISLEQELEFLMDRYS